MAAGPTIHVYPADDGGCGRYRLRYPGDAARTAGADVTVHPPGTPLGNITIARRGTDSIAVRVDDLPDADVVVLQRVTGADTVAAVPYLQAHGIAVVVDVDDDLTSLPKGHPYRVGSSPVRDPVRNRRWVSEACRLADLVTVSTPRLAEVYGRHGRTRVLPNCVPAAFLEVAKPATNDPVRIGWTGSTITHIGDLDVCGDGVARALRASGARFRAVGTGVGVREQLHLGDDPEATGWVPIDDYPAAYATLDVAVVPLAPNPFNEAKSWLKGMEAAALGVPFVASPTAPYRALHAEGAGWLAEHPDDWAVHLTLLALEPDARAEQAAAGRTVAARWTYERHAEHWVDAWTEAVANRRRRKEPRIAS